MDSQVSFSFVLFLRIFDHRFISTLMGKVTRKGSSVFQVTHPEFLMKADSCVVVTETTDWKFSVC